MFMHTVRDDSVLGTMRFVSRHANTQVYGTILPKSLTNQALLDSVSYKTYHAIASGAEPPMPIKGQKKSDSAISSEESPSKKQSAKANKVTATKPKPSKKKAPIKADRGKGLNVPNEQHFKTTGADEGTGTILGVPDVRKYDSSEKESWGDSGEEDEDDFEGISDEGDDGNDGNDGNNGDDDDANDDDNQEGDDTNNDNEETDSDRTESDNIKIPVLNQSTTEYDEEEEEKIDDEETMDEEEDDEVTKELYDDVIMNLGNEDTDMTNADQANNEIASLMETSARHATSFPEITSSFITNIPPPPLVTNLETYLSEIKQVDQYAQALSSTPAIVDHYIDNKLGEAINKAIQAHNLDCKYEAHDENNAYIELILPQAVSDFANPVIEKNVTESLEAAILTRSSSQPKSTYEAAASFSEFELIMILLNKMEESKSHLRTDYKKKLYDALVESYNTDEDLFNTCGEIFTLKRSQDDRDKDQDPSAGLDRGTKRRKSSKEAESSKDLSHTVDDSGVQQDQEFDTGNNDEQPADQEVTKDDWFKKPERPLTPDSDWNKRQHVDSQPPQTWISQVARAKEPHTSYDELIDTSFDFFAFFLNRLNIKDLTQEILVGPAFELLKGTCKSLTELEYHLEECSKATTT
ncbi:hypothetical protein Tco_0320387 [Tanacetum coccineum]